MSNFSRFNFDNYEPQYPNEEARITDYLSNLRDVAPQSIYNAAFGCLVKNDKKNLAELLYKLYARIKGQQDEINGMKGSEERINGLIKEIERLQDRVNQLNREKSMLQAKLNSVYQSVSTPT